jgi:hypothetical protein
MNALALAGALLAVSGCYGTFHDVVDPCYPERYNCKAREEVRDIWDMQSRDGLALEQTLYVYHFEPGSEVLHPGGIALLTRLANRRPAPETVVFVQTAQNTIDLDYKKPEEYANKRKELDEKRKTSVESFLRQERPDVQFTVVVANPSKSGISGQEAATAIRGLRSSATGYIQIPGVSGGGGSGASSGGGAATGTN